MIAELELYGCIPQNIGKCRSNNSTLQTPAQQLCYQLLQALSAAMGIAD